ncbi:MAG TPA: ATP-dependent metallopeptidase FtsH/Yme1/Tma family protein, partial [Longimicrobiales bacterium]|nr:ATP-dependent metallopeptidase FtsH/Yme1/Tma family protein [Longimicrobiales bacterium]
MSKNQMPERDGKDEGPGRWARSSRTLSFWVLFVLVSILLVQLFSPQQRDAAELIYSQVVAQLEQNNVTSITIIEGREVEGELRTPITTEGGQATRFVMSLPMANSEAFLQLVSDAGVDEIKGEPAQQNWWAFVLGALPWILILGIWIFMLRQMQSGGSRAFQFGKSKARLLTGDTPQVTFADVSGADEAKEELKEIIEFLKDPQKFTRLGGRLPKGALLIGPPGTGKTLLARAV